MKKKLCLLSLFSFLFLLVILVGCGSIKYDLSVAAETGGYIQIGEEERTTEIVSYKKGTTVNVVAKARTNYVFEKWICNNVNIFTTESIDVKLNSNTVCLAKFNYTGESSSTLTINKTGEGSVFVNGQAYTAPVTLPTASNVYLIAKEATDYTFEKWICGETENTNSEMALRLNEATTCTASFKSIEKASLTLNKVGAGSIFANGRLLSEPTLFVKGEIIQLSAIPSSGYIFTSWTCNGAPYTNPNASFELSVNYTCSALFEEDESYAIINIYNGGSVDSSSTPFLISSQGVLKGSTFNYEIDIDQFDSYLLYDGRLTKSFGTNEVNFVVRKDSYNITYFSKSYNPLDYISIGDLENGSAQVVEGSLNGSIGSRYALVASPNTGYHFKYWTVERKYHSENSIITSTSYHNEFVYSDIIASKGDNISIVITPVFDADNAMFTDIAVTINRENGVAATVTAPLYIYNSGSTNTYKSAFYLPLSTSYALTGAYVICGGAHIALDLDYTNPYHVFGIKYSVGSTPCFISALSIDIADLSDKAVVSKVAYDDTYASLGIEDNQICKLEKVCNISSSSNTLRLGSAYYYLDHYEDTYGNVYGVREFEYVPYSDVTFLAIYKEGEVDGNLLYHSNSGNSSYSVELYKGSEYDDADIVIPAAYKGKAVNSIPAYGFAYATSQNGIASLTVPASVTSIGEYAFKESFINEFTFDGDRDDLHFSMFYCAKNYGMIYHFTDNTLQALLDNQFEELIGHSEAHLEIHFVEQSHLGDSSVQGHYEGGARYLCVKDTGGDYTQITLTTIVHEFRHFYQYVAVHGMDLDNDSVKELTYDTLKVKPTVNQVGAWAFLDYTSSDTNYEKYWHDATEIDAREYATSVMGYASEHDCEFDD